MTYTKDHRPGMDDGTRAYLHTGEDGAIGTDVYVITNVNLSSHCCAAGALERRDVVGCVLRLNRHVGTNGRIPSDGDSPRIKELAPSPNFDMIGNGKVVAVVAHERSINGDFGTVMSVNMISRLAIGKSPPRGNNGFEKVVARLPYNFLLRIVCVVETVHGSFAPVTLFNKLGAERREGFSAQHLVLFAL